MRSEKTKEESIVEELFEGSELPSDGVLVVHSAFSKLSHAGVDAKRFIDALSARVPDGTLVMPAMTWRTVTDEHPYFDELETPSITGVLSETFRTHFATHRSIHPTHSVAAMGMRAEYLVKGHEKCVTPCPPESPFGRLEGEDAHILLLGVGMESCTVIHCWEELISPDFYLRPESEASIYFCCDRNRVTHEVKARRHNRLDRDFQKFGFMLEKTGKLREGEIHRTKWQHFKVRDLREVVMSALEKNNKATLAGIS